MSACFAGSRSVDERRRRRIATESDPRQIDPSEQDASGGLPPDVTHVWPTGRRRRRCDFPDEDATARFDFPLTAIIPQRALPTIAVTVVACLPAVVSVFAVACESSAPGRLGPGFARLAAVEGMGLPRLYAVTMLSISGLLAILIRWGRSRSIADFSGQYRNWGWISAVWFLAAAVTACEGHLAWRETVAWHWQPRLFAFDVLSWALPSSIFALATGILALREMRRCRLSSTLFVLAGVCFLALACACLPVDWPLQETVEQLVIPGLGVASTLFLAVSMLLHCRFVLYHSADPPVRRRPRRQAAVSRARRLRRRSAKPGWLKRLWGHRRVAKPSTVPTAAESDPKQPSVTLSPANSSPGSQSKDAQVHAAVSDTAAADVAQKSPSGEASADSDRSRSKKMYRVDAPIDASELRGLSKREQRRLRKEHRQKQRLQAAGQ